MAEPMTVALVGADGAGKSSVAAALPGVLEHPVTVRYGGTTRGAPRRAGAARGSGPPRSGVPASGRGRHLRGALRLVRMLARLGWERGQVELALRRGHTVVTDRHPFADHLCHGLLDATGRPWHRRLYLAALRRWQPPPDLAILLEAPAELLFARKGEGTVADLARRQAEYRRLAPLVGHLVTVDATRPLEVVVADVARAISRPSPLVDDASGSAVPPRSAPRER